MSKHSHLTPEIFEACDRGEISRAQLYRLIGEAVCECEGCRERLEPWRRPYHQRRIEATPTVSSVLQLLSPPTDEEHRAATQDLKRLLKFPKERRVPKVRRAVKRYRSPVLAELLLEKSLERLPVDSQDAEHLASLAQSVLLQCRSSVQVDDLRILCLVHLAIASKAQGNLQAADGKFRAARQLFKHAPAPHPRVEAELSRMEGSYRKDRRQLEKSEQLLQHAVKLYDLLGDRIEAARARLVLGATQFYAGAMDQALATTTAALTDLNSRSYRRLFLIGRYNLTLYLAESGRVQDAAVRLRADLTLYREAFANWPSLDIHFHWLAGKVYRGLQRLNEAEEHLIRARDGFVERGTSYDAILVCLDLALVYAAQKRSHDLVELADLMISGLAAQGLHDESMAAVSLAAEAARNQSLTEKLVRNISHFLQFSRHDPALKWANVRDLGP